MNNNSNRILVVDDNRINRLKLGRALKTEGYEVLEAAGGREALEILQSEAVDLVLLDLLMPEVDGYEATRRIRLRESEGQRIPIVGVTASAIREDLDRCYTAGMDAVLSKPYQERQLRETLSRWLPKLEETETSSTDGE